MLDCCSAPHPESDHPLPVKAFVVLAVAVLAMLLFYVAYRLRRSRQAYVAVVASGEDSGNGSLLEEGSRNKAEDGKSGGHRNKAENGKSGGHRYLCGA